MDHALCRRVAALDPSRRRLLAAASVACVVGLLPLPSLSAAAVAKAAGSRGPGIVPIPPQVPAHEGVAELSDVRLWYWDTGGNGEVIVLLHPMTGSGLVWPYQQPIFAKAGYRVIGYSRRGFYNSSVGPSDRPGTGSEDLRQLLDFLGIEKFHAVSSAGGAFVAADFAASYQQRVRSLVLACTMLGIGDGRLAQLTSGQRTPGFRELPASFRELGPSYRAIDPDGTRRWEELERNSRSGPGIRQPYTNKLSLELLRRLTMPTLVISGEADLFAPPPVGRLLVEYLPDGELVTFPECGHSAYWERPAMFNEAVLDFLSRRGRGG